MALLLAALPLLVVSNVASFWAAGPLTFAMATLALLVFAGLLGGLMLMLDPLLRAIPGFYKAAVVASWTVVIGGFFLLPQAVPWVLLALLGVSAHWRQRRGTATWRVAPGISRKAHAVACDALDRRRRRGRCQYLGNR
jgi:hypothetical protein